VLFASPPEKRKKKRTIVSPKNVARQGRGAQYILNIDVNFIFHALLNDFIVSILDGPEKIFFGVEKLAFLLEARKAKK
jgi:hypothetical protein